MLYDKLFGSVMLPIKPPVVADGAMIQFTQAAEDDGGELASVPAFFGGYADDLLGDLGFDMAPDEAPTRTPAIKRV
jgi:hypothetical protein